MNELKPVRAEDYINELRAEIERLLEKNARMRYCLKQIAHFAQFKLVTGEIARDCLASLKESHDKA